MITKPEILERFYNNFEKDIGMSYEEFDKLDFDVQQKILYEYRKKHNKNNSEEYVNVLIGYGDNSTTIKVKKGEQVMTRYGNITEAGLSLEEEHQRLEDALDEVFCKQVPFIKKIGRKNKE